MLAYYLRIAWKSCVRTPGLTLVMIIGLALGISACIVTLTVFHAMSNNPIWWKSRVLYAVTIDTVPSTNQSQPAPSLSSQALLSYPDATYLEHSKIAQHSVVMTVAQGALNGAPGQTLAIPVNTRATTSAFFQMFAVPFEYGGPWDTAADHAPDAVIVLSHRENDKLFAGANSVGRTLLWNNHPFRIVGVLAHWDPRPRFYDMTTGDYGRPEPAYIPLEWLPTLHVWPSENRQCWGNDSVAYQSLLGPDCIWLEMWVQLPDAAARTHFLNVMNAYTAPERNSNHSGPGSGNHLWNVGEWLQINHAVSGDSRLLLHLAFAFLLVCLINTIAVLLAKFVRMAPRAGIRRALGASRRQIVAQHLVEALLVSLTGSVLGLLLTFIELDGVRAAYRHSGDVYGELAHFDPQSLLWALALAALSTVLAGLYPAWRAGQISPAAHLRNQ